MDELMDDRRLQLDAAWSRLAELKDSVTARAELRQVMVSTEQVVLDGAAALERHLQALSSAFAEAATARPVEALRPAS